jgi:hypothetical protein
MKVFGEIEKHYEIEDLALSLLEKKSIGEYKNNIVNK